MVSTVYMRHGYPDVMPPQLSEWVVPVQVRESWADDPRDAAPFGASFIHTAQLRRFPVIVRLFLVLLLAVEMGWFRFRYGAFRGFAGRPIFH